MIPEIEGTPPGVTGTTSFTADVERNIIGATISPQAETVITRLGKSLAIANSFRVVNEHDELAQVRTKGLTTILSILGQKRLIDTALQFRYFPETPPEPVPLSDEPFSDGLTEIYPGETFAPLPDSWELGEKYQEKLAYLAPYIAVINPTVREQPLGDEAITIVAEMGSDLRRQSELLAKDKENGIAKEEVLGLFDVLLLLEQPQLVMMAARS